MKANGVSALALVLSLLALVFGLSGVIMPNEEHSFAPYPQPNVYKFPPLISMRYPVVTQLALHNMYADLYIVTRNVRVDSLRINCIVAGGSGTYGRLGLYSDNGNLYPNELIVDGGIIYGNTTGYKTLSVDVWLEAGYYWFVQHHRSTDFPPPAPHKENFNTYLVEHVVGVSQWKVQYINEPLPDVFPSGATSVWGNFEVEWRIAEYL